MKKILPILALLFSLSDFAFAQAPGMRPGGAQQGPKITGKITGTLVDSISGAPVEFATIVLVNTAFNKQLDGVITDEKGVFKLQDVRPGKYELQISFLGYQPKVVKGIELTPEKPDYDAGNIQLYSESLTLTEVTVTDERAAYENKIDKIVYNADKDVTTRGGDASDVLQRVPLVAVDAEGNVSLRGSSNILILINGKPSTIFSGNVGDALKTIPADQIKSVEVVTTPTAKYDGEGTAGILNIVTKKKSIDGFTGSINTSVGTRSNRASLNLNLARGRFGLNMNGSGWYGWPVPSSNNFFRSDLIGTTERTLIQNGNGDANRFGPRVSLGAFYDINAYNSISTSVSLRGFGGKNDFETEAFFIDPSLNLDQEYTRISESNSVRSGFEWTTDYRKTFQRPEQELSFAVQISGDYSTSENSFDQFGNDASLRIRNNNENQGINVETTIQTDYVHPLSKTVKLETGAKAILRQIDSDYYYENFDFNLNTFVPNTAANDIFYYDQDVWSGYASFNFQFGKNFGLVAGARYEHTTINGDYKFNETSFANSYDNILPSLILSRKVGNFSNIKLAYNQRIQRPSLRVVNPYIELNDPRDITIGNPDLLPEINHQVDLSYSTFVKGIVLNGSVYYRFTGDVIENFLTIDPDGVSVTTFRNIGETHSIGANFFTSITIKKIWTVRGGVNVFSYNGRSTVAGLDLSRDAVVWNGNLNSTLSLKNGLKIEAFGFYSAPRQSLQGTRAAFSRYSIGASKDLFNKKASLGINITQPFQRDLKFPNVLEGSNFYQESNFQTAVRSFNLNFNYSFGKLDFRQQNQRRTKIRNDDLKDAGGDMQQQR